MYANLSMNLHWKEPEICLFWGHHYSDSTRTLYSQPSYSYKFVRTRLSRMRIHSHVQGSHTTPSLLRQKSKPFQGLSRLAKRIFKAQRCQETGNLGSSRSSGSLQERNTHLAWCATLDVPGPAINPQCSTARLKTNLINIVMVTVVAVRKSVDVEDWPLTFSQSGSQCTIALSLSCALGKFVFLFFFSPRFQTKDPQFIIITLLLCESRASYSYDKFQQAIAMQWETPEKWH